MVNLAIRSNIVYYVIRMSEEEMGEILSEKNTEEVEEAEYLVEDVEIEGLSVSEVELFLSRAGIWDDLLQNRISINEAQNILMSLSQMSSETTKVAIKKTRRKKA